jgi:hypothetical protein
LPFLLLSLFHLDFKLCVVAPFRLGLLFSGLELFFLLRFS